MENLLTNDIGNSIIEMSGNKATKIPIIIGGSNLFKHFERGRFTLNMTLIFIYLLY